VVPMRSVGTTGAGPKAPALDLKEGTLKNRITLHSAVSTEGKPCNRPGASGRFGRELPCTQYTHIRKGAEMGSAKSVRVNLTLPGPVHAAMREVAEATGQSVSQTIAGWLTVHLPEIRAWGRRYRSETLPPVESGTARVGARPDAGKAAPVVNRAERRRQEKDEKRAARGL